VEVRVPHPEGGTVRVAEIGPGEVIGEMSLLTGEARSADVCALDEVEVLEVGKAAMGEVLAGNDALAEALSRHISARLDERTEAFARATAPAARAEAQASLLQRIRQFFDLG
jgi:CRP-like cAMP-binding protein